MAKKNENKATEQTKQEKETVKKEQLHKKDLNKNIEENNKEKIETNEADNRNEENKNEELLKTEEQLLESKWLEDILNHPIKTSSEDENNNIVYETKLVKDIIDSEKDIWFSSKKRKPIIKETGARKLIAATGATFPKIIPIEKQSDASSKDREQVWIEATVLFPDGTAHEEYGVANRANCPDSISQSNLPIMARKRAMHRAFYRSEYIGLFDVYDENEMLDVKNEKNEQEIKRLNDLLVQNDLKHKKLINQMCKEIKTDDGELVWSINNVEKLVQLSKGTSLVSYIAMLRIRHINKGDKK